MTDLSQIAVLSDVHGNTWALEAVLEDVSRRGIHAIVNLGDSLYGPLDPAGTADRLMLAAAVNACGNEDRVLCQAPEIIAASPRLKLVVDQLEPRQLDWLRRHVPTCRIGELFLCHGAPASDTTYLLEEVTPDGVHLAQADLLQERLAGVDARLILCGHSHVPHTVQLPDGRLVINPGSVGLQAYTDDTPYSHAMEAGSPHARYAVLTVSPDGASVEHVALPYAWEKAAETARRNGRPDWEEWLRTGRAACQ